MKDHVETMVKRALAADSAILTWLVVHAAQVLNCYKVFDNGRTAYELITGHRLKSVIVPFGEKVHFMNAPSKTVKVLTNWKTGIYIGNNTKMQELIVGNEEDIHMIRSIRREVEGVEGQRGSSAAIDEIKMIVAETIGGTDGDGTIVAPVRAAPAKPVVPRMGEFLPRHLYLKPRDYENFGYTGGCPGCISLQSGMNYKRNHTEECRSRLMKEMMEDPEDKKRVEKAQSRMDHYLAEQVRAGEASREVPPSAEEPGEGETLKDVDIKVQHEEQAPEDSKSDQDMEETVEELMEAPSGPSESREDKGGSPRKRGPKRSTGPPERTHVKFKQGLDDMPIIPTEHRTRDDALGPRTPAQKHSRTPAGIEESPLPQRTRRDEPIAQRHIQPGGGNSRNGVDGAVTSSSSSSHANVSNEPNHEQPPPVVLSALRAPPGSADICEVFSPERVCARCTRHGLVAGSSFDLHTGYDLSKYKVQREVEAKIDAEQPELLIGSPPCTKFSILQNLVRAKGLTHEQRDKFERDLAQAVKHVNFCVKLYHRQRVRGRYDLHEHPLTATSWQVPSMKTITSRQDNYIAECHMCAFGMTTVDPEHGILPAKKPTRFATNSWSVAKDLSKTCSCKVLKESRSMGCC